MNDISYNKITIKNSKDVKHISFNIPYISTFHLTLWTIPGASPRVDRAGFAADYKSRNRRAYESSLERAPL